MRTGLLTAIALFFAASCAPAQSIVEDQEGPDPSIPPSENLDTAASRAPGTWINAALGRHNQLQDSRIGGAVAGERPEDARAFNGSGSSAGSSGSGSLLDGLFGSLGTDVLGMLGDSFGLDLGGLLGGTNGTTGGTQGTGDSGTGSSGGLSNLPPDVIAMLEAAGVDLSTLNFKPINNRAQSTGTKLEPRAQTNGTNGNEQETPFRVRLTTRLLETFFTSVSLAFQTPQVVDMFADFWRPILQGGADNSGNDTGNDNSNDNSNDNTNTNTNTNNNSNGGGVEDLNGNDNSNTNDNSGSIVLRPAPLNGRSVA